jgi:molybdenum cofactor cytidylyltransferase
LLGWVVKQATSSTSLDEVMVVLGRAADEVRATVDFGDARVVENPVFTEGCASSYKAGLSVISPESDAVMILLGVQPGVGPEIINRVADQWRKSEAQIALASYRGRKGHPMIFARPLFKSLEGLHGDKAAWKLVDAHGDRVQLVELDFDFPSDINTPADVETLSVTRPETKEARKI